MNLNSIKNALVRLNKTKTGLAQALGVPNSAITEMLAGNRSIKSDEIPKIVKYLDLDCVPIVGRIGIGGQVYTTANGELGTIRLPFPVPDDMVAFEVTEGALYPRYDAADVLVVWLKQRRPLISFFGEEAIVDTRDGRRFLRHVMQGRRDGLATLHSFNAPPVENARPTWLGEIYLTVRATQRRQLAARTERRDRVAARAARGR